METYTHVCAHRGAYMREMTLWDGNPPGPPYTSPADGTGRLARGPQGQDREAAFADWHRANYGTDHADPCDGSPAPPAASPRAGGSGTARWVAHREDGVVRSVRVDFAAEPARNM